MELRLIRIPDAVLNDILRWIVDNVDHALAYCAAAERGCRFLGQSESKRCSILVTTVGLESGAKRSDGSSPHNT